jgi:hypothetical protein
MQTAPATALPDYDQKQLDKRFLVELDRLLQAEAFPTYTAWAKSVQANPNIVAGIASGRYHCNLKMLYRTLRLYPAFDFNYVVFGSAVYARPEPTELPARPTGPSTRRAKAATPHA